MVEFGIIGHFLFNFLHKWHYPWFPLSCSVCLKNTSYKTHNITFAFLEIDKILIGEYVNVSYRKIIPTYLLRQGPLYSRWDRLRTSPGQPRWECFQLLAQIETWVSWRFYLTTVEQINCLLTKREPSGNGSPLVLCQRLDELKTYTRLIGTRN